MLPFFFSSPARSPFQVYFLPQFRDQRFRLQAFFHLLPVRFFAEAVCKNQRQAVKDCFRRALRRFPGLDHAWNAAEVFQAVFHKGYAGQAAAVSRRYPVFVPVPLHKQGLQQSHDCNRLFQIVYVLRSDRPALALSTDAA